MSHAALTAKYRPQTFAQVAGQDTLKRILSRASLEGKVAPAYLFSGTRGVGKTTLARIFAKALNCRTAPTAEPCNQCDQCRAVTCGNAVDVVEIDGASNRGIDDVRRLKEVVGYAAMEGGYKIFIIDEAHMLSREAFNALLKTLEEPPPKVVFIMATTEPHKFPATIISRCQHFVFKALPESALTQHLTSVLEREQVDFEANALRLIARRGAGSVRDSMSLLGQVLALGDGKLTEQSARGVLGLAGQEAFLGMAAAFRSGDVLALSQILRKMLDQGLDMGFFLRELASLWRNMFILRQSGEAALAVVDLPENEARACLEASRTFSLPHIHACWQMTLEGQRRVLTSLEPALALELLLFNLAVLPELLPLEKLSTLSGNSGSAGTGGTRPPSSSNMVSRPLQGERNALNGAPESSRNEAPSSVDAISRARTAEKTQIATEHLSRAVNERPLERAARTFMPLAETEGPAAPSADEAEGAFFLPAAEAVLAASEDEDRPEDTAASQPADAPQAHDEVPAETRSGEHSPTEPVLGEKSRDSRTAPEENILSAPLPEPEKRKPDWTSVFALADTLDLPPWLTPLLRRAETSWQGETLALTVQDSFSADRLNEAQTREALGRLLPAWCGFMPELTVSVTGTARKSREELQATILEHPLVKEFQDRFGARIVDYGQRY